nr:CCR4-Not transcription complex subunit 1 [Tanacetum cinerariifolium]
MSAVLEEGGVGGDPSGYVPTYSTRNTTSSETLSANLWPNLYSWMPRKEASPSPIHPSVQEAIGARQQRNDRRLPGLDTAATTIGPPSVGAYFMLPMQDLILPVVISYVNAAIDTTAIGFKRRRFSFALNIKTLFTAAECRETPIEAPPSETQDKISFIINNLSIANIEPKAKEFTEVLKEEYYHWSAQYMVMKTFE